MIDVGESSQYNNLTCTHIIAMGLSVGSQMFQKGHANF